MSKIYQKTPAAGKNAGFTLIELLVVVLIIGILAAIALPKYEMAVEKSRASNAISALRAIKDAEEVYYMANGSYTDDISLLDMEMPELDGYEIRLMESGENKIAFYRKSSPFAYQLIFSFDDRSSAKGILYCAAQQSSAKALQLCAGYGPVFWEDSGWKRHRIN